MALNILTNFTVDCPGWMGLLVSAFSLATIYERDLRRKDQSLVSAPPKLLKKVQSARRILIVGAGDVGRTLALNLEAGGEYKVVGFVDDEQESSFVADDWKLLGRRKDTAQLVQQHNIDEVVIAYSPTWQQVLIDELAAQCPDVGLQIVPSSYESLMRVGGVRNCDDIALVRLTLNGGWFKELVKRSFDIFAALMGLLLFSPFFLVTATLVKLFSPGPVIFAQERIGRYGKPFTLYKIRTMIHDAEAQTGPTLSQGDDDPRLTRIGRWFKILRLDEIPQLWNVLKGEMSLVGPRPERSFFVDRYTHMVPSYRKRHLVRPGITGLAQVCGGYHTDARDKLRFDLIYVSHHSLGLDLMILLRTVLIIFRPKGW
jgi:exopolysaccharide biosynthesis polyprenyl glycosylphosphotransferase